MSKLSILMVVSKYPATYGHTSVINSLCLTLNQLGHRAAIGAFSFSSNPPNTIEKIKLNKFQLLKHGVNELEFDVVHSHQSRMNYYLLSKKPKIPVFFHFHGTSTKLQEINFKLSMFLHKKRITKLIPVSQSASNQISSIVKMIPVQVVHNGIDSTFFQPNLPILYKKGTPQLLFVSALRKYKNTRVLIESIPELLKIYPNINLQIIGDGEEFIKIKELIHKNHLEKHITMLGKITNAEEIRSHYSSCDIYISASSKEASPMPPLEAMSCGKPTLLYDIEAHRELINSSNSGLLFSSFNPTEICNKINLVLSNKEKLGFNARKYAEIHDWSNICKELIKIYNDSII